MEHRLRDAEAADLGPLAVLWHRAWHEAHGTLVPEALVGARSRESFEARVARHRPRMRVAGPPGAPLGLCMVDGDELAQLFVAAEVRGTGLAATLLRDGEARMRAAGTCRAWLACAVGNDRAAGFYERHGWSNAGPVMEELETEDGGFALEVWRFEKALAGGTPHAPDGA